MWDDQYNRVTACCPSIVCPHRRVDALVQPVCSGTPLLARSVPGTSQLPMGRTPPIATTGQFVMIVSVRTQVEV
jgi:hypothetical protein